MSYQDILYTVDATGIATVTLNRPQALNAWTRTMEHEVYEVMALADKDPAVRVIIITGAGKGFCAGGDKALLAELLAGDRDINAGLNRPASREDVPLDLQGRFSYLLALSKPVISVINGAAAGVGLMLAMYSDWRFAATSAKLTTAFAARGLAAEHGAAWILPRIVGLPQALDLLMSSRVLKGSEAERIGLVHRAYEPDSLLKEAYSFAADLAVRISPRAMGVIKRQIYQGLLHSLAESISLAELEAQLALHSEDFAEGLASFKEKRAPVFTGR